MVRVKHVNKVFVALVAEATVIAQQTCHVTTIIAKILAMKIFVDQIRYVKSRTMQRNVIAQPDSKEIQRQSKAASAFHRLVFQQKAVQMATCASQMCAKYLVPIHFHVQLANDATITSVQRFVSQTTIAYLAKSVMNAEHVKLDAKPKAIARQHKYVKMENVNVVMVSLERHSAAQTLTNVPIKFVIRAPFARTHRAHLDVSVQSKQLVIHTHRQDACYQTNVCVAKIVPRTWLASKESALNHVPLPSAEEMQFVKQTITKLSVFVHQEILVIQLIRLTVASVLSASAAKIVVQINSVIHKLTNVKIHAIMLIVVTDRVLLSAMKPSAHVHQDMFSSTEDVRILMNAPKDHVTVQQFAEIIQAASHVFVLTA